MQLLTASRLKAWRRCARLHDLTYNQGYRPTERPGPLRFGSLVHRGLEAWWRATADPAIDALEAALGATLDEADPYDQARAQELLRGYHYRWRDAGLVPLAVEAPFEAPLANPKSGALSRTFRLAGKIDAIARDAAGRVVLIEHKTSSEQIGAGSDYFKRLRLDGQVSAYFEGARSLRFDAEAMVYDVLGKPGLRSYQPSAKRQQAETPEEFRLRLREAIASEPERYYQRAEVVRLEAELDEHRLDDWESANAIRYAQRIGLAPRNPDGCVAYGRTCAFFDVCSGAASLDDPERFQKLSNIHPELAEASSPRERSGDHDHEPSTPTP